MQGQVAAIREEQNPLEKRLQLETRRSQRRNIQIINACNGEIFIVNEIVKRPGIVPRVFLRFLIRNSMPLNIYTTYMGSGILSLVSAVHVCRVVTRWQNSIIHIQFKLPTLL